jgi:predicted aspartyl protease
MHRTQTESFSNSARALAASCLGALLTASAGLAAPPPAPLQVPGYQVVQLSRQTINHLETTIYINGKPEPFGIDTGANCTVMNAHVAMKDGAKPTESNSAFGQYQYVKGQTLRVAMVDDLRAGGMDFGRGPVALYTEGRSSPHFIELARGFHEMSGLLGADILLHYKAIINVRNRQMFFPMRASNGQSKLAATVAAMGFTRVPLRQENGRGLTVPCTIAGKSGRLLVDTGAFSTFLDASIASELRMPTQPTAMNFSGFDGRSVGANFARVSNLEIGPYHLPPQSIFVVASTIGADLSRTAETRVFGLLGADLLAAQHGIIDLESMSLFLK